MLYLTAFTLFIGLITPKMRTLLFIYGFLCLSVAGVFNGYLSAIMMRLFGRTEWRIQTFFSAVTLPFYIMVSFLTIDFIEYEEQSSSYIPLTSLALYTFLWFLSSVPLSLYGSYRGHREQIFLIKKVNALKRSIPQTSANSNAVVLSSVILAGAFIFTHVAVQFYYVLTSVWRSWMFAVFGVFLLNIVSLVAVIAVTSMLMTYWCLQSENWNWWWRAYMTGASAGLFMYIFCVYQMAFVFKIDLISGDVIFLLYSLLTSVFFGLICGLISLAASYAFVIFIFEAVRAD